MDNRDSKVRNVLKRVLAAYNEPETTEGEIGGEDLKSDKRLAGGPHIVQRYYFYNLSKDSMIKFSDLKDELKSDPYEVSRKLTTGLVAHKGDHFEWKSIIVKTNLYDGITHKDSFVVFKANLTPDGGREPSSGEIIINNDMKKDPRFKRGLTVTDDFLKDNEIFVDGKDVNEFLNIEDEPTTSFFYEGIPTDSVVQKILNTNQGGKSRAQWEQEVLAYYRVWSPNSNSGELRVPDLSIPKDGYLGTEDSIKKLEKATGINIQEYANKKDTETGKKKNVSGEPLPEEKGGENFVPVDEQSGITKEEAKNRFASDKKEETKKDYSKEPYGGGFSIMQNLVKDQKKNMKIREAAKRVVMAAISGPNSMGSSAEDIHEKTKATEKLDKVTQNFNKTLKQYKDLTKDAEDYGCLEDSEESDKSASVDGVLKKYLN